MADLDDLVEKLGARLEKLSEMDHHAVAGVIADLQSRSEVWDRIPSGNRQYLTNALAYYDKDRDGRAARSYLKGAKNHITRALTHQLGFIALQDRERKGVGEELYDLVLMGEIKVDDLPEEDLIGLAKHVEGSPELSSLRGYQGSRSSVQAIIGKYERLGQREGVESASRYAGEKAQSLRNIFKKVYLPQLSGAVARGEIRL